MPYLPYRVKKIEIDEDLLVFYKKDDEVKIFKDEIKYIFVGLIKEEIKDTEIKGSKIRKMLRGAFTGQKDSEYVKVKKFREQFYVDIVVKDRDNKWFIFRIDPTSFHYKGFVDSLEYTSMLNFKKFLIKLKEILPEVFFSKEVDLIVDNKKLNIVPFKNLVDFQEYVRKKVKEFELAKLDDDNVDDEVKSDKEQEIDDIKLKKGENTKEQD